MSKETKDEPAPRTTSLKHLYAAVKMRTPNEFWHMTIEVIARKYNLKSDYLADMPVNELVALMDEYGDAGFALSIMATNALNVWRLTGCQTFSLCDEVVDLLACTKAPDLADFAPVAEAHSYQDILNAWNMPYPAFAIELPYPTSTTRDDGVKEYFNVAVCMPFHNHDINAPDWTITYLTPEDVANTQISMANGTAAIGGLLTNLCLYLNEGGTTTKAGKRIGYDKAAKKAKTKVNIWKLNMTTVAGMPRGCARTFIESGEVPPKTFRVGKRFMVRGHWRNQVCGEGRKERKRKWIRPHLKGPEDGETFSRVYQVK